MYALRYLLFIESHVISILRPLLFKMFKEGLVFLYIHVHVHVPCMPVWDPAIHYDLVS